MYADLNQLAGKVEALRFNGDSMVEAHDSAIYSVRELIDQLLQANQAREKVSA
jgi:hypothetical protein